MHRAVSSNNRNSTFTFAFIVAMTSLAGNSRATVETTDTEEAREQAKQEALDRKLQQKAPSVNLLDEVPTIESLQPPASETPSVTVQHFVLEVPSQQHSPAAHCYGASTAMLDTFRFAQNFLEQYTGRYIGCEGANLIVKGVPRRFWSTDAGEELHFL